MRGIPTSIKGKGELTECNEINDCQAHNYNMSHFPMFYSMPPYSMVDLLHLEDHFILLYIYSNIGRSNFDLTEQLRSMVCAHYSHF